MLRVENLSVHYGRIQAVRGVSLDVNRGEIVSLLGPNGAGKSSTIRTIVGAVRASAGSVVFEEESLVGRSPEAIVRLGLALVPEGRHIFSRLTVAENLSIATHMRERKGDVAADVERVYERFPVLRQFAKRNAGDLSGGQQQQLAIGRALMCQPKLLLLDEPSLGLAPLIVDLVFDELVRLKEEGVTILLVEQNAHRALEIADRAYILNSGEVRAAGTGSDLMANENIEQYYFGVEAK